MNIINQITYIIKNNYIYPLLFFLILVIYTIFSPQLEKFTIPEQNIKSFKDVELNMEMTCNDSLIDTCQNCREELVITKRKLKECQDYKYYRFPYSKFNIPNKARDGTDILQVPPEDLDWMGYDRNIIKAGGANSI